MFDEFFVDDGGDTQTWRNEATRDKCSGGGSHQHGSGAGFVVASGRARPIAKGAAEL